MKAIICTKYGPPDVLKIREIDKPVPKTGEILVKVIASSINALDWRIMRANPFFIRFIAGGFFKPKRTIPGADYAGIVEETGPGVKLFKPGDEVFGFVPSRRNGTFTEYVCVPEDEAAGKPVNLSFEQAAAVPLAAMTALQGLRDKGGIQSGLKVLIQGASGGVGTFAVQTAKFFGAEVTAVCSTRNIEMVKSIGADFAIDYKKKDFTGEGKKYGLIFAVNGYRPIKDYMKALSHDGIYAVAGGSMKQLMQAAVGSGKKTKPESKKVYVVSLAYKRSDLLFLKEAIESGKIKPVIDKTFQLSETADAFRYYEKEHAKGKIVITI